MNMLPTDFGKTSATESWSYDPLAALRKTSRLTTAFAIGAGLLALIEGAALVLMMPLKTVVPYTIVVDRQTGYAETIKGLEPGTLTQDQAVVQAAIVQYLIARETFDAADLTANYRKVTLWSAGDAREQYVQAMKRANPSSPLNQYPATTTVATTVKSVSILSPGNALVRFSTLRRDQGASGGSERDYTSVITYRFSGAPMRMEDRFLNPLGFQALHYRRDAEGLSDTPVRFDGPLGAHTP